jgi:hypothetical protein
VSSYRVSVGDATVRVKNFRAARSVVAEAITSLLARDPEAGARGCRDGQRGVRFGRGSALAYCPPQVEHDHNCGPRTGPAGHHQGTLVVSPQLAGCPGCRLAGVRLAGVRRW